MESTTIAVIPMMAAIDIIVQRAIGIVVTVPVDVVDAVVACVDITGLNSRLIPQRQGYTVHCGSGKCAQSDNCACA